MTGKLRRYAPTKRKPREESFLLGKKRRKRREDKEDEEEDVPNMSLKES